MRPFRKVKTILDEPIPTRLPSRNAPESCFVSACLLLAFRQFLAVARRSTSCTCTGPGHLLQRDWQYSRALSKVWVDYVRAPVLTMANRLSSCLGPHDSATCITHWSPRRAREYHSQLVTFEALPGRFDFNFCQKRFGFPK